MFIDLSSKKIGRKTAKRKRKEAECKTKFKPLTGAKLVKSGGGYLERR